MATNRLPAGVTGYLKLLKPLLTLAVTFSGVAGFLLLIPYGGSLNLLWLSLGLFLVAGGSAALNQYQERDYDKMMPRTSARPIPAGLIPASHALIFSLIMVITGFAVLSALSIIAALLALLNLFVYNFIYTPLKRKSYLAILPGGVVGAIPPVIGFIAAGGSHPTNEIVILSLFMFTWQLPHFWLLMIRYSSEYRDAGFATLSDRLNESQIRRVAFVWSALSSLFLLFFALSTGIVTLYILIPLLLLNISFIVTFYLTLFSGGSGNSLKRSFILLNIFSVIALIIMIVLARA